ncbi:hypothetical protein EPUS_00437 [Endocarpon pusillum Z07020]|uniref:ditrans,polycis-polyprenyl diphosphate synthase [(2E,6E)-farnesyldiphosphate specific] n=1 Tax=Endocarpon pusillum (strain Z07020 / HMAS-L-300199) TaxID=1263415 RepID=U1HMK9_ENDPU|nr:uncharacterized protein EPUS_00437 [Endocarpon pusillum Z07020]ERF70249.1 hypothetical protein EPUS_00437 [Endocarpon pusillum Z07020]
MVYSKDTELYRRDVKSRGREFTAEEREKLVKPYLPPVPELLAPSKVSSRHSGVRKVKRRRQKPIRSFLKSKLHVLLYFAVHLVFGIYLRLRQTYHAVIDRVLALLYYHHRTPELIQKDVKNLSRLPEHLSVVLTLKGEEDGGLESLMEDVAELSAWCASIGIPLLSIYERSGILKSNMRSLHSLVFQRLSSYFGASQTPSFRLHAPSYPSYPPSATTTPALLPTTSTETTSPPTQSQRRRNIEVLLLSSTDGRDTLVDLTRTLAEMSQSHKLHPRDITQDLIDAELSATTSISLSPPYQLASQTQTPTTPKNQDTITTMSKEPDLLIIFGPYVKLDGYPPWQVRLTEIFCVGESGGGNSGRSGGRVEYQGFLRGLWMFAAAEMRFGR